MPHPAPPPLCRSLPPPGTGEQRALAHLAHEVRTLAGAVLGTLELWSQAQRDAPPARLSQMLSAQARALLQLVDGTLAEQQRRATTAAPPYECLCPLELVHEVAFELQVLAERKGLALSVSASPAAEAARVKVERMKVAQILRNLISNAIKFTQHGFVAVNLDVHDGQLFVAVRDSGVGMSAEAIDRLFERYAPGSHPQSGSGLGLWIALELARRLGGMVLVESQPGAGSCFTLRLPLAPRVSP